MVIGSGKLSGDVHLKPVNEIACGARSQITVSDLNSNCILDSNPQ